MRTSAAALTCVLVLTVAGCGGDDEDSSPSSSAATTTGQVATTAATTQASAATEPPATTEPATTTTTATTLAADAHPHFGAGWAELWPADGATAIYRVADRDGTDADVPALVEYDVEWRGGTWDRLSLGEIGGETGALRIYLHRSGDWVVEVGGVESYAGPDPNQADAFEIFPDPLVIDLSGGIGEPYEIDTTITIEPVNVEREAAYLIELVSVTESLSLDFGDLDGVARWRTEVSGPFAGNDMVLQGGLWVHPDYFVVKIDDALVWEGAVLVQPWG